MKKSIPFLALLVFLLVSCNKSTEPQVAVSNDNQNIASDRESCCASLVVSSTYFGGLTVCGVASEGAPCTTSTSCGNTCGGALVLPNGPKTANFCFQTQCPLCFTNPGVLAIQIYLICTNGTSPTIDIPAGGTVCVLLDCDGSYQLCR